MKKSELQKIIREEVKRSLKEGKLTTYLDPKQKEALLLTTQKVNELIAAIDDASKVVLHNEIKSWLGLSKQDLIKVQARLNQIDL